MDKTISRVTPCNESYPTCELTYATLGIYHVDPRIITQKLNLEPISSKIKGVPNIMPSGVTRIGRIHNWLLSSEKNVSSKDLRRHLDWLLDKLEPVTTQIKELQKLPGAKMAMRCVWWSAHGQGGPTLWPEQMKRMADLNLECAFSLSFYGEED